MSINPGRCRGRSNNDQGSDFRIFNRPERSVARARLKLRRVVRFNGQAQRQSSGTVLVTVPDDKAETRRADLMTLEHEGLRVMVEAVPGTEVTREFDHVHLEIFGQDHPGIVRDITHVLAEKAINISEIATERSMGAMSAEAVFRLHATIELPGTVTADELRTALEVLAGNIMVEVDIVEES